MEKIIFSPSAVYFGSGGLEVLAGAELSPDEIRVLVKAAISPDHFSPVFLIHNSGHRQRLSVEYLETVLASPLAAYRQKLAQEATKAAEAMEKAYQEAEALRIEQEAQKIAQEAAAKAVPLQTIG